MSNLPPGGYWEPEGHEPACRTNCGWYVSPISPARPMCDEHDDHDCNCDDIAQARYDAQAEQDTDGLWDFTHEEKSGWL